MKLMTGNKVYDVMIIEVRRGCNVASLNAVDKLMQYMEWVDPNDIEHVATHTAKMAVSKGYVSGELWDEIGAKTLHNLFWERMTVKKRIRYLFKHWEIGRLFKWQLECLKNPK